MYLNKFYIYIIEEVTPEHENSCFSLFSTNHNPEYVAHDSNYFTLNSKIERVTAFHVPTSPECRHTLPLAVKKSVFVQKNK